MGIHNHNFSESFYCLVAQLVDVSLLPLLKMKSPIKKKAKYSDDSLLKNTASKGKALKFAIDGNIAAGKSTLIDAIERIRPEWNVVQEPVARWTSVKKNGDEITASQQNGGNLLKMFYDDKHRWSYTFQSYALFSKLRLHAKPFLKEKATDFTGDQINIFERSYYSDRYIFAENCYEQGFMVDTEWNIYKEWCDYLVESLGGYDLAGLIYLRASPEVCVERGQKRGRPEEKDIPIEYIKSLHRKHDSLLLERDIKVNTHFDNMPILVLDCDEDIAEVGVQSKHIDLVEEFIHGCTLKQKSLESHHTSSGCKSNIFSEKTNLTSTGNTDESCGSDVEF